MTEYSSAQKRAVTHNKGPALVIAGPGSGKTFVLTQRIKYLITYHGVSPEKILVITFTKAAAEEMKERSFVLLGAEAEQIVFGTFHSVFFRMLRISMGFRQDSILAEKEKRGFLYAILAECGIQEEEGFMDALLSEISMLKNKMDKPEQFESRLLSTEQFRDVYTRYERLLCENRKLDFDDMIRMCFRMLKEKEEVRRYWQERFSYILIDEYQDVNRMQAETVKLFLGKERNLFVVGDDDQAIYGFRGADPAVMLAFQEEYADASVIVLGTNYRCNRQIVEAAGKVIEQNQKRFEKKITASKQAGGPVDIKTFPDEKAEYKAIADWCREHPDLCTEAAVIVRTNREIGWVARFLEREHIPYRTKERVKNIYGAFPGSDILAYLKFAAGQEARKQFFRIMNKPVRYIARNGVGEGEIFPSLYRFYRNNRKITEEIGRMEKDISFLKGLRPYAAFRYIMNGIGYGEYLNGYCREHGIDMCEIGEDLRQIEEDSRLCADIGEWIRAAEENTGEDGNRGGKGTGAGESRSTDGICLCTMHGSKGLEYDTVFLPNVNEGTTPYRQAKAPEAVEEERRMFYVAMTRAKKQLHLWNVKNLNGKEVLPSRFLEPLCTEPEKGYVSSETISSNSMSSR